MTTCTAETNCSGGASLRRKPSATARRALVDVLLEVEGRRDEDAWPGVHGGAPPRSHPSSAYGCP
jgi:hypothetical protein